MFPIEVPDGPGEPIWWWLFWFAASLIVYAILMTWFYRVGKRETRDPDGGKDQ